MFSFALPAPDALRLEDNRFRFLEFLVRYERAIFVALLGIHLIPVFIGNYFPTAGGPAYLYNADLLKNLISGHSYAEQFHLLNTRLDSSWFSHVLMASLLALFAENVAEKVMLGLYLISFPVAIRFAIMQLNRRSAFLSLLAFPFLYNYAFQFGFFNYCLSLVFLFAIVGYWLKVNYQFTQVNKVILLTLITLVYITHPVSHLFSALVLLVLTIEKSVFSRLKSPEWKTLGYHLGQWVQLYLPTGLLTGYCHWSSPELNDFAVPGDIFLNLYQFFTLNAIRLTGGMEKVLVGLLIVLFLWGGLIAFRQVFRQLFVYSVPLLIVLTLTLLLYLFVPDVLAGDAHLKSRLALTFYLFLILFFATVHWPSRIKGAFLLCCLFFAITFLFHRIGEYRKIQAGVEEVLAARAYIKPHSVILPFRFEPLNQVSGQAGVSFRQGLNPYAHIASYLPIGKDAISLANVEAHSTYSPLRWQIQRVPDPGQLGQLEGYATASTVNIAQYEATIKQSIDYVVITGLDTLSHPLFQANLKEELDTYFHPVYTSPNRLIRVYEKVEKPAPVIW